MKNNIVLSIIIPVYNGERSIKRAIISILNNLKGINLEVIVIDDGSTDNTKEEIFSICDDCVTYYYEKNSGPATARNYGLQFAKGDYILFLDADDYINTNVKEVISKAIDSGCTTFFDKKKKDDSKKLYKNGKEVLYEILDFKFEHFVWGVLYKNSIILNNKISFRDNMYMAEDIVFNISYLLNEKNEISYFSDNIIHHTINENSLVHQYMRNYVDDYWIAYNLRISTLEYLEISNAEKKRLAKKIEEYTFKRFTSLMFKMVLTNDIEEIKYAYNSKIYHKLLDLKHMRYDIGRFILIKLKLFNVIRALKKAEN